jgi:hypothetical protein
MCSISLKKTLAVEKNRENPAIKRVSEIIMSGKYNQFQLGSNPEKSNVGNNITRDKK